MPKYLDTIEGSDVPSVPEGRYRARLAGIEQVTTRYGDGFRVHWTLADANDFELTHITSTATTAGSKMGRAIRALLGRGLKPRQPLPLADVVGRYAILEVTVNPESGWNRVEDILPTIQPGPAPSSRSEQVALDDASLAAIG